MNDTTNADINQNTTEITGTLAGESDYPQSSHTPGGNTCSKFILHQSKKPSGSVVTKSKDPTDSTDDKNYDNEEITSESNKTDNNKDVISA